MNHRNSIVGRMVLILGLLLLVPAAIAVQIFRVQVFHGNEFEQLWAEQALDEIPIPAQRGLIYDRKGRVLVTNRVESRIILDPKAPGMTAALIDSALRVLSKETGRTVADYRNIIRSNTNSPRYILLERRAPMSAVEAVRPLKLNGLIIEESFKRAYNYGTLASHVLGFMGHEGYGLTGLEASYNVQLQGNDGAQQVRRDRSGKIYSYVGAPSRKPVHGLDIHTTLDATIQAIVEEELANGIEQHKAKRGVAIVMDPRNGELIAMANMPTYDPNEPAAYETSTRRNIAIADMIEPGSTFKLITAIAAVENNKVELDEVFETPENGIVMIKGQPMRDHEPLGTLNFSQVFSRSSNVATSEIAMRLSPQVFYQYARNMGFGSPTNIDLPNEVAGRLQKPFEWSAVTLPWMSIGYEVLATPLQVAQAYAAFANDGLMMKPYVVNHITDADGDIRYKTEPTRVRRIAERETLEKLYPVFEEVLEDSGTARMATIDGLRIAGKTGTAQKFVDGRYRTSYYASFAGFFPVEDPKYVILVIYDEPRTVMYGGWTAGLTFREITKRLAGYDPELTLQREEVQLADLDLEIVPHVEEMAREDVESLLKVLGLSYRIQGKGNWITAQDPAAGDTLWDGKELRLLAESKTEGAVTPNGALTDAGGNSKSAGEQISLIEVPDLNGLNMRQARHLLRSQGLKANQIGSGTIFAQFPKAGTLLREGKTVTYRGRARELVELSGEGRERE